MARLAPLLPTLFALLAAGCGATPGNIVGGLGAAEIASITVLHRGMFDTVYSAITGKDCSIVRLDQGKTYCRPLEPPPAPPPYCTRSLGVVDCWQYRTLLPDAPPSVADAPSMTPEQEKDRTRRWPPL